MKWNKTSEKLLELGSIVFCCDEEYNIYHNTFLENSINTFWEKEFYICVYGTRSGEPNFWNYENDFSIKEPTHWKKIKRPTQNTKRVSSRSIITLQV